MATKASQPLWGKETSRKKNEEWTHSFNKVLQSMNGTLSTLFDGLEAGDDEVVDPELTKQLTMSELVETFQLDCKNIIMMLGSSLQGPVKLPLGSVLNAVGRCLKVSYSDVKSVPSMAELKSLLPVLHQCAIEVLAQLIVGCKSKLLPRSRIVTDFFLMALESSKQMDGTTRKKISAKVFQGLCLLVETFGWGGYLESRSKAIIQELINHLQLRDPFQQVLNVQPSNPAEPDWRLKGRKKRKNKAESYLDLTAPKIGAQAADCDVKSSIESTSWALRLSKLLIERAKFSISESLVRCLLQTTATFQREGAPPNSAYTFAECRKHLYSAIFACTAVTLDLDSNRKDALTHFQIYNMALSLLNNAHQWDSSYEVIMTCKCLLDYMRVKSGNLNRPMVRWILPDDDVSVKDVTELERDAELLTGENEKLRERLVETEVESQRQTRLIAQLRQEIQTLKEDSTKNSKNPTMLTSTSENDTTRGQSDGNNTSDDEEIEDEAHEEQTEVDEGNTHSIEPDNRGKKASDRQQQSIQSIASSSRQVVETTHKDAKPSSKRKQNAASDNDAKKVKATVTETGTSDSTTIEDGVQDMISDFVDADPDLF